MPEEEAGIQQIASGDERNATIEPGDEETRALPQEQSTGSQVENEHVSPDDVATLSKNQQKKLKRKREWEEGREWRKMRRKEKTKASKERKRAARNAASTDGGEQGSAEDGGQPGLNGAAGTGVEEKRRHLNAVQQPITIVIDCQFDELMHEKEIISLASQITRSYSDNKKAPYRAHLCVSSFGGKLKARFDSILDRNYAAWRGVRMLPDDFVDVGEKAKEWMREPSTGGSIAGALGHGESSGQPKPNGESEATDGEMVYLSSDSGETLHELKPYSTYVIGGLVDKNRHKGICYRKAMDRGVKTAKLPIGEFLQMQSRSVLTTNHVNEIMLKWLELGDWGKAFMEVIPKRKGGTLKDVANEVEGDGDDGASGNGENLEGDTAEQKTKPSSEEPESPRSAEAR